MKRTRLAMQVVAQWIAHANATVSRILWTAALAVITACCPAISLADGLGAFILAAPLGTPRSYHTATLLTSGEVMVSGGANFAAGSDPLASAELYDPAGNAWSAVASMVYSRSNHSATLLPSGKMLVVGGQGFGGMAPGAELYDRGSNTWSAAGVLAAPRTFHSATLLASGKVLVAGGSGSTGNLVSAELYDPATNTWSLASSMVSSRGQHTATLLTSGKVLVVGGNAGSAELYDPTSNTWSGAGSITTPRILHTATLLPSGQVLIVGGTRLAEFGVTASAEIYDPASNTWSAAASMSTARTNHTATLLPSRELLVAGGEGAPFGHIAPPYFASAELYNLASNSWSAGGTMASAHTNHTATLLPSSRVLVAGAASAFGTNNIFASTELYDAFAIVPQAGLWWNPAESGSGYALDVKHGVLVVTLYSYNDGGAPIWYLAAGPITNNTFTGTLDKYSGGQCIACSYKPATINGNDGDVGITFASPRSAVMTLPGGRSFMIEPQPF